MSFLYPNGSSTPEPTGRSTTYESSSPEPIEHAQAQVAKLSTSVQTNAENSRKDRKENDVATDDIQNDFPPEGKRESWSEDKDSWNQVLEGSETDHVDSAEDNSISGESTATSGQSDGIGGKSFAMKDSHDVYCRLRKDKDRVTCHITCFTALADGELVIYDAGNFKLKAFDSDGYFIGAMDHIYNCRDITSVTGKKFAITQEDKTVISIYSVKGGSIMSKNKHISLPGKGYHCRYARQHYAVICDVTDANFRSLVIKDSDKEKMTKKLPTISVSQIAMNPEYDVVYLSDSIHKRITCIDFRGNEIWFQDLRWVPFGLCVVAKRYLLVCNVEAKTLFKLEFAGKQWEEIADFKCFGPVCYSAKRGVVYVTIPSNDDTETRNKVHVLKIKNKKLK